MNILDNNEKNEALMAEEKYKSAVESASDYIENFEKTYLNDINNIPVKYRGMLYKRWYCDSFRRAVKIILSQSLSLKMVRRLKMQITLWNIFLLDYLNFYI